jgi:hypothetical protein
MGLASHLMIVFLPQVVVGRKRSPHQWLSLFSSLHFLRSLHLSVYMLVRLHLLGALQGFGKHFYAASIHENDCITDKDGHKETERHVQRERRDGEADGWTDQSIISKKSKKNHTIVSIKYSTNRSCIKRCVDDIIWLSASRCASSLESAEPISEA